MDQMDAVRKQQTIRSSYIVRDLPIQVLLILLDDKFTKTFTKPSIIGLVPRRLWFNHAAACAARGMP